MRIPSAEDLLSKLIELYADQNNLTIKYELKGEKNNV